MSQEDDGGSWTFDANGKLVELGLTKEEKVEYTSIMSRLLQEDDGAFPWQSLEERSREMDRWYELHNKIKRHSN
jgi:hypothetical protein